MTVEEITTANAAHDLNAGQSVYGDSYYGDELVIITTNIAGASTAAAVIPYDAMAEEDYIPDTSRIYVVDNGQDTAIFQFDSSYDALGDAKGGGGTVTAIELTLIGTLKSVAETTYADYGFL